MLVANKPLGKPSTSFVTYVEILYHFVCLGNGLGVDQYYSLSFLVGPSADQESSKMSKPQQQKSLVLQAEVTGARWTMLQLELPRLPPGYIKILFPKSSLPISCILGISSTLLCPAWDGYQQQGQQQQCLFSRPANNNRKSKLSRPGGYVTTPGKHAI